MLTIKYVPWEVLLLVISSNHAGNNACQENHKRIDDTLYQRQRNHITVADVRHLVRQNRFDLVRVI